MLGRVESLKLEVRDNNVIRVTCGAPKGGFKGPKEMFIAHLDGREVSRDKKCSFEVKDLSYLTTYTVMVRMFKLLFDFNVDF